MRIRKTCEEILTEIGSVLCQISEEDSEKLINGIESSDRVFLSGAGRSGLVAKAFAMRLMHLGFSTHVVGDSTTPAMGAGDLLIVISGSGNTATTHLVVSAAKAANAKAILITSNPTSRIGNTVDLAIVLPMPADRVLPLGATFEAAAYVFLDAVVLLIMKRAGITPQEMKSRHTNLE